MADKKECCALYPKDGYSAVLWPNPDYPLTMEEICMKDLPEGTPFKIILRSEYPIDDVEFQEAFMTDFSNSHGHGLGYYKFMEQKESKSYTAPKAVDPVPANIVVNMDAARKVWRDRLARTAKAKIAELRDLHDQYVDEGRSVDLVMERRKALRDIVNDPAIDAAKTLDELKAFWPAILEEAV